MPASGATSSRRSPGTRRRPRLCSPASAPRRAPAWSRAPPEGDLRGSGRQDRERANPSGAVELARAELAAEFLAGLRHLDDQLRETKKKLAAAVRASRTTLTDVFGVGPVVAGTIIGDIGGVSRFPGPVTSPPATAPPPRSRCRQGT